MNMTRLGWTGEVFFGQTEAQWLMRNLLCGLRQGAYDLYLIEPWPLSLKPQPLSLPTGKELGNPQEKKGLREDHHAARI